MSMNKYILLIVIKKLQFVRCLSMKKSVSHNEGIQKISDVIYYCPLIVSTIYIKNTFRTHLLYSGAELAFHILYQQRVNKILPSWLYLSSDFCKI